MLRQMSQPAKHRRQTVSEAWILGNREEDQVNGGEIRALKTLGRYNQYIWVGDLRATDKVEETRCQQIKANLNAFAALADHLGCTPEDLKDLDLVQWYLLLEFYRDSWRGHSGDSGPGGNDPQEPECWPDEALMDDVGNMARQALAQLPQRKTGG